MQAQSSQKFRILDFDIENRPLSYLGSDFTTAEVTAIAAGWVGETKIHCWLLGETSSENMLDSFCELYEKADCVTGHYILRHDLPIINGALLEHGLPSLGEKRASDTKIHLIKRKDLSASQESLAEMYGLPQSKYHMSQPKWRAANRLTPEGLKQTRKRVVADVRMHKSLREALIRDEALKSPTMWRP